MSDSLRVLVCGGRDFRDRRMLTEFMDKFHAERPIAQLIHGAARGADALADDWANDSRIYTIACPADWEKHSKSAGPIRNQFMLDRYAPEVVIAFPGGSGTAHMVKIARAAGIEVIEVNP